MYDIVIIGGGPNGLFCLKRCRDIFPDKKIILIEKDSVVANIKKYPNVPWHSKKSELTLDGASGTEYHHPDNNEVVSYYEHYYNQNSLDFIKDEVLDIKKHNSRYKVCCSNNIYNTEFIILATGVYENPNLLNINTNFPYISYNFADLSTTGQNLVLIGGGSSSLDYVIHLLPKNKITWVIRGASYTTNSAHLGRLENTIRAYSHNLTLFCNTSVKEFKKDNSLLLSNDHLIQNIHCCNILIGYSCKSSLFERIGIEYINNTYIKLDVNYQTSLSNVYVCGSIATQLNDIVYIHNGNSGRLDKVVQNILNKTES